jgi:hypothetical protein
MESTNPNKIEEEEYEENDLQNNIEDVEIIDNEFVQQQEQENLFKDGNADYEDYNESDATFSYNNNSESNSILNDQFPEFVTSQYLAHEDAAVALAVHPVYNNFFVSGGMDDKLFFFEQGSKKPIGELLFEETINQICFSADGLYLAVGIMGGLFVILELSPIEYEVNTEPIHIAGSNFKVVCLFIGLINLVYGLFEA